MDVVDTFNHLIPSDQLDESLIIGQNLECEGSNECGPGIQLEDSLKNMLSDKDPMFGSASSQFNLLDGEETTFPIAASTGLDDSAPTGVSKEVSETEAGKRPVGRRRRGPPVTGAENSSGHSVNTRSNTAIRGRLGKEPLCRLQKSFLIEKGVKGTQLKKELSLGGRINVNDLDRGSWLNPLVVLRRLTVTIGGFKIELLPGPSYTQNVEMDQSVYFDEGPLYSADIGVAALSGGAGSVQDPTPENTEKMEATENACAGDASLALGPYVNPNDVQSPNGTGSESAQEAKPDSQNVSDNDKSGGKRDEVKEPQSNESDRKPVSNKIDDKVKQQAVLKSQLKSKQGVSPVKKKEKKDVVSVNPNNTVTGQEGTQNLPSRAVQREDQQKMKTLKEKKDGASLKRPGDNVQNEHATKVQKTQVAADGKEKPKQQVTPNSAAKKSPSGNRVGPQGSAKQHPPHSGSKVESAHLNPPIQPLKATDEGGAEKHKLKKPEKLLQKQKNKSTRSISVDEPQLFIPDNAPVVKKETLEEQPATTESVWDGNNCCGLCKKHHNNMFMVGCGRCDDWFHGDCVGLDLTKVREMEEEDQMYVCLKCCEEESKKVEPEVPVAAKPEAQTKPDTQHHKPPPKPQPGPSQTLPPAGVRPVRKDQDRRQSTDVKEGTHKTVIHQKQETKSKPLSSATKKPVSVEAIRRSVRDSLKEILIQRLKESNLNISVEKASDVAKKIERELFHLYKDTDNKYKNKYRSLMFNLKDTKNNVLYKKVLRGDISPGNLIRMSPEELASKELAAWRKRENRHTIEMIEKEQREAERRPITKITHKGEIEIESQEPMKTHEPPEPEPPTTVAEVSAESPKSPEKKPEKTKTQKDTTSQHKSHLFDLNCKICTGRMAPPVEEAPTKVIKVATTVVKRQPTKVEETKSTTPPSADDDLHLSVLEESFRSAHTGSEGRSDLIVGRDVEAVYLSGLITLWRGFIHMHAVAKLVTKAFPVSGIMDNLNEDLPDSIQVVGRISPQIVWDYLEKIRATGTKEVCLIRFSPETEEDEISYTLLYAYFSSRKRFGVVSNNLKQVKDMYLIPLGAIEKVPHQLVPFDGPGLENNRPNLLLGLIIRQRPKRDFLPMDMTESKRVIPEPKPIPVAPKEIRPVEEEKRYFASLTVTHDKEKERPVIAEVVEEPVTELFEEPPATETSSQESLKPLRFLPGVLVGKGGDLEPLPDVEVKPAVTEDAEKTQQDPKTELSDGNTKSPTAAAPRFIIKKKEAKPVKAEQESASPANTQTNQPPESDAALMTQGASVAPVSLKYKPPDVSTEAFLESFSAAQSGPELGGASSTNKGATGPAPLPEKGPSENPVPQTPPSLTNSSKPPLSGILKKSSSYSSANEDKATVLPKEKASPNIPVRPKPGPGLSSTRSDAITTFHQGVLQISQARYQQQEDNKATTSEKELPVTSQTHSSGGVYPPSADGPQQMSDTEASEAQHHTAAAVPPQQPQVLGSSDQSQPDDDDDDGDDDGDNGDDNNGSEQRGKPPPALRHYKQAEEQYHDPWERPRNTEDRDPYGRHGHHRDSYHGKKSRHHDREREKKHDRNHDDKHREKSRHHGHSDDRYGEKRKERQHSDDYSSRHKERHRHRRDSDYENGRRRDSYS